MSRLLRTLHLLVLAVTVGRVGGHGARVLPNFGGAIARRNRTSEAAVSMQATHVELFGELELVGVGETLFQIPFPVEFIEPPNVNAGAGYLLPDETVVDGLFPTWNVGVKRWITRQLPITGVLHYLGAELVVVCTGRAGQRSVACYRFLGVALRNPTRPAVTGDDTI